MGLSRRKARIIALEALYQLDIAAGDPDEIIKSKIKNQKLKPNDFVLYRVKGVLAHKQEIDGLIEANVENWTLDRIAVTDRNILRLAAFELLYCQDVPFKVVINEAVELGKIYGTEESSAFINGVLDKVQKTISK